jgi:hypothetical protein
MVEAVRYKTTTESTAVSATSGGASGNVLYTCPAVHTATIDMLMVTNGNTSNQKITIEFYHADDTTYHNFIEAKSVSGNTALNVLGSARMHLHAGDKIVVSKDGGTFDVTISVREFYNPNR